MTLCVTARYHDGTGFHELPMASDLAGLERARHTFYGSDLAKSLGLKLLPLLRTQDLEVRGDELHQLDAEVVAMLQAVAGRDDSDYWTVRLGNIRCAIALASAYGDAGSVIIS